MTFFEFIAQEVRELLAQLGFRSIEEAVGHVEMLDSRPVINHWKAEGLDLEPVLAVPAPIEGSSLHRTIDQEHGLARALDHQIIALAAAALDRREPVRIALPVRNVNQPCNFSRFPNCRMS